MPAKQRVAMIEPVGGHGGMDYYDFGLCAALAANDVNVILHTCDETAIPADCQYEVRHSYRNIYGESPVWKRGLVFLEKSARVLWSACREKRRIVHFHFFFIGPLQAFNVIAAKLLGRRIVITAHDVESFVDELEIPRLSLWIYRLADRVIAHNQVSRQELIDKIRVKPAKIAVIPHGNYLHTLAKMPDKADARRTLGIKEDAEVLLFFGQIKDVKGLDILLSAMPALLSNIPSAILLIAGKPWKSDFARYAEQIEALGLQANCVCHTKFIPDDVVGTYFAAADVVVLPYRRIYQSGVVLMAMSYGKPVVVSSLPGMLEIISDGESGRVFRAGDVENLSEVLQETLCSKVAAEELGKKGFEKAKNDFDWLAIGAATRNVYEALV